MQREETSARWNLLFCFVLGFVCLQVLHYVFSILDSGDLPTEAEGNCLRFYLLQKVSTNAMRALLDKKSVTFAAIWNDYQKFCTQKKGKFLKGYYYFIHLSYHLNHWVGCIISFFKTSSTDTLNIFYPLNTYFQKYTQRKK